jgi:CRP/FNR family transcriptional regulator, cyclic AMP receptor protein
MVGLWISARLSISLPIASVFLAWVIPAVLFALVIVASVVAVRWAFSHEMSALHAAPLFSGLSRSQLRRILGSAVPQEFPPGTTVVNQGEQGDAFYLVREGTARVMAGGSEKATLGPRSYFGEISVIDGGARTATVVAETKLSTVQLTSRALLRTLERYPSITRLLYLKLRALLQAEGDPGPYPDDAPVDHATLADLARRLRTYRDLDWSQPPPPRRRSLLRG